MVLPVPGGPWIRAMSGVFSATSIAFFWFAVGSWPKIFARTVGVSPSTRADLRRGSSRPPSSISSPKFGFADRPAWIRDRASIRRLIWETSLATG